jgi:hypothetical protein
MFVAGVTSCLGILPTPAFPELAAKSQEQLERDLTVPQKPIVQIGQLQGAGQIEVEAWVDRPNLTYVVGQPLRVMVRPHQDAYVTAVDVSGSGRVAVLFPNYSVVF